MKLLLTSSRDRNTLVMSGRAHLQLAAEDDNKTPPRFTINAYNGGIIKPDHPFRSPDAPLIIELAGVRSVRRIAAVLDHDDRAESVVGQTTRVRIGNSSIDMEGVVTGAWQREGTASETVVTHARNGFVWQVSLGGHIKELEFISDGIETKVNGRTVRGPIYVIRRVQLRNISFLSDGADQSASARIAARSAERGSQVNFHEWLKELGFDDPATLSEDQREHLEAKFDAEQGLAAAAKKKKKKKNQRTPKPPSPAIGDDDDDDDDDDIEARLEAARKRRNRGPTGTDLLAGQKLERERRQGIEKLMMSFATDYPEALDDIEAHGNEALKDGEWTVQDFENLLLRETTRYQRIDNQPRSRVSDQAPDDQVIESALCMSGGMSSQRLEKAFNEQTLETAHRRWRHGLSLNELLLMAARGNGFDGDSLRGQTEAVLVAAFPHPHAARGGNDRMLRAAGPSTYDVSGILSNVMNKFIVDYFSAVDLAAMRAISARRPVNDFKQITSYSLTGSLEYEKVAPGGELKYGTFGEEKYTNQADTYGKILSIDRRDLINDDLGALTRIAQRLGRGGALKLLDVFWTIFINNSTFFKSANNNFFTGASTALDVDSLTTAKSNFDKQTDPDGKPIGVEGRILLVQPELKGTAEALLKGTLVVIAGSTDKKLANANIHQGTLDLARSRELSNSSYTGNSAKAWYLLASPDDLPVIETAYLNGVDIPTVENAQANFNILGIQMRAFFDFGVALQEFRAGIKMKGEA